MEQNKTLKKSINYIDNARGIAIILMVVGHVVSGYKRAIIFSFHMPLFIIISGFFFKPGRNLKEEITNIFKKLIIPYIVSIIIIHIVRALVIGDNINILNILEQIILAYSNKKTFFQDVETVGVLWFIPFLAMCKIIFWSINKISKDNEVIKACLCLICTMVGILLEKMEIYLPWSFDIVLASIIFYYIGYFMKKNEVLEEILENYKILLCIVVLYIVGAMFGYIELAIRKYPFGLICYITAISGTIIVFKISKIIEEISKIMTKILCWYGKNSMYILCAHFLEMGIIPYNSIGITEKWKLIIVKLIIVTLITYGYTSLVKIIKRRKVI